MPLFPFFFAALSHTYARSSSAELKRVFFFYLFVALYIFCRNTFWRIVKNRSTEEFESIPYIVLLLNASQWTYYGIIKPVVLLVTINGFGSLMMIIYLVIFLIFAPPRMKVKFCNNSIYSFVCWISVWKFFRWWFQVRTAALVVVLNVGFLVAVILVTSLMMSRHAQINTVGTLCVCVTILSFGSPLAAIVRNSFFS